MRSQWSGRLVRMGDGPVRGTCLFRSLMVFVLVLAPWGVAWAEDFTVTVRAWPPTGGTVTRLPDQATYQVGDTVALTATAAGGWVFDHWAGTGFDTGSGATATVEVADHVLAVAYFKATGYVPASSVFTWGSRKYGQLGDGAITGERTEPQMIDLPVDIVAVAAGRHNSFMLTSDGRVYGCGLNSKGQLSDGTTYDRRTPIEVTGIDQVVSLAAAYHVLALRADGTVWSWGANSYGQVGDGTTDARHEPLQVAGLPRVAAVAAGLYYSLAVGVDGSVWAWGSNEYGQLGDRTNTDRLAPVQVDGITDAVSVSAFDHASKALTAGGEVWLWGYVDQLGINRSDPFRAVGIPEDVTSVSAGSNHTLILPADGTVWAWGRNDRGQLGNGTTSNSTNPVRCGQLEAATLVAAGSSCSFAALGDGTVWAWGFNHNGRLGDGTTTDRHSPVAIQGISHVRSIAAGDAHTIALADCQYTLTAWTDPLGAGTVQVTPDQAVYELDQAVTIRVEAAPGHSFSHWERLQGASTVEVSSAGGSTISFNIRRDMDPVAVFEKDRCRVVSRVWPPGSGTVAVTPQKVVYDHGETVSL